MNLPKGYTLQKGKYQISEVVGQGGFGITYRGIWKTEVKGSLGTMKTKVPVCIKEFFFKDYCYRNKKDFSINVHSSTGKLLFKRFKDKLIQEAKILSELHHPHIVNVVEVFEENNTAYIAMEFIEGYSLKDRLAQEGTLSEKEVLGYVKQIGEALDFVHKKHILHLDIKPSNILIGKDNITRLIDFGVSKRFDLEHEETSTTTLTLSKGFASIEQYDKDGMNVFSPQPDIYSLGATMYNLLTGKVPTESILCVTHPLQEPRTFNASLSKKTNDVIVKATRIIPKERYTSIQEMLKALDLPKDEEIKALPHFSKTEVNDNDETTLISNQPHQTTEVVDDEETELKQSIKTKKPKHKKTVLSFLFLFITIGIITSMFFVFAKSKDKKAKTKVPTTNVPSKSINAPTDQSIGEMTSTLDPKRNESSSLKLKKPNLQPNRAIIKDSAATRIPKTEPEKEDTTVIPVESHDKRAFYDSLLNKGNDFFAANDIDNARLTYQQAKGTLLTEEIILRLIACDNKEKELKLQQYETKMPFGDLQIVRKKSNNLYGAINKDGKELIPCIYLSVGKTQGGRSFERKNHLFDIYNQTGKLIKEGQTFY